MTREAILQGADALVKQHDRLQVEVDRLAEEALELAQEEERLMQNIDLCERVRQFLQRLSRVSRDEVGRGLEQIVTLCLQAIFGEHLSFMIDFKAERNTTAVYFYVIDDSVTDDQGEPMKLTPENAKGGSVVDIIAIGLRFGLLKIIQPKPEGPIILDEPAKMVSKDLIESVAGLLEKLSAMFGKQTITVTHHPELSHVAEYVVVFAKSEGKTIILEEQKEGSL